MSPWTLSSHWYIKWKEHIRCAKLVPSANDGFCRAAAIAQAEYVLYLALEHAQDKKTEWK